MFSVLIRTVSVKNIIMSPTQSVVLYSLICSLKHQQMQGLRPFSAV